MITPLPHWVLTDNHPAFYDTDSNTAIKMVAKLYGKMQELVADYNEYVDRINKHIEEFENGIIDDFDEFKECVMKTVSDYIQSVDMKIANQDKDIADAVQYMKDNIVETTNEIFAQALRDGTISAELVEDYDAETKELTLSIRANEGE